MKKRYNFRIYPNEAQKEKMEKTFGCCRKVYNYYLEMRKTAWDRINKTFGTNVTIEINPIYKQGVTKNEQTGKTDSTEADNNNPANGSDDTNVSE